MEKVPGVLTAVNNGAHARGPYQHDAEGARPPPYSVQNPPRGVCKARCGSPQTGPACRPITPLGVLIECLL